MIIVKNVEENRFLKKAKFDFLGVEKAKPGQAGRDATSGCAAATHPYTYVLQMQYECTILLEGWRERERESERERQRERVRERERDDLDR